MNSRILIALSLCFIGMTFLTAFAQPKAQPFRDRRGSRQIRDYVKKLESTRGDKELVAELAEEVVEEEVDVTQIITLFAAKNLIGFANETNTSPIKIDLQGKEVAEAASKTERVKDIEEILGDARKPDSPFRKAVEKFIKDTDADNRVKGTRLVLQGTIDAYSPEAIAERTAAKGKRWPFPFCLLTGCD